MTYEYIRQSYGKDYRPGIRVKMAAKYGTITKEDKSCSHYVQVRFDDRKFSVSVHPLDLEIVTIPGPPQPPKTNERAVA